MARLVVSSRPVLGVFPTRESEKMRMMLPSTAKQGRYRLDACIAGGQTYSRVYQGLDTTDGSVVAIKQAKRDALSPRQCRFADRLFQREAAMLAELHHPGLPCLRDVFEEQGVLHLVMEYIEGETLQQRLDRLRRSGKCLSLDESLFIGTQLCRILAYLHGQTPPVIHRDLKPANVILGPGSRIYLIDFSIARRFTQSAAHLLVTPNLRQARGLDTIYNVGSRGYAPREQYGEAASTSPPADIYGLGALLHYLLSGVDPATRPIARLFAFAPLRLSHLPEGFSLATLIARMTESEPARRPTMSDVRETLEACSTRKTGWNEEIPTSQTTSISVEAW